MFYGNCTELGPKAREWLGKAFTRYDIIGLAETHVRPEDEARTLQFCRKKGRVAHMASAVLTVGGGTSGGVLLALNPGKQITFSPPKWSGVPELRGHDWVGSIITVKLPRLGPCYQLGQKQKGQAKVFSIKAYFNWTDPVRCNQAFRQILYAKRALGYPAILTADFNHTPPGARRAGLARPVSRVRGRA